MQEILGGVLIVGSLLWEDDVTREKWRNDWLKLEHKTRVYAPVRYGRPSRSRGCTYTMVFSRVCLRPSYNGGTAVVVPLARSLRDADSLVAAARELWGAETKTKNSKGHIGATWGAIGILANPASELKELIEGWQSAVEQQPLYSAPTQLKSEGPIIDDQSGRLLMPWPRTIEGRSINFDVLLATATDPELLVPGQRYPSAKRIAAAWIADWKQKVRKGKKHEAEVKYFLQNRKHGICTFQDVQIRRHLSAAGIETI